MSENIYNISIVKDDDLIFTLTYNRPRIDPPLELDPTPFVEEEDFDFCLFLLNVLSDPGRKERIYR